MEFKEPSRNWCFSSLIRIWKRLFKNSLQCRLCFQTCLKNSWLCECCSNDLVKFNLKTIKGDLTCWPATNVLLAHHKFDYLVCVAPYQWPYNQWIKSLKYQHCFELAPFLSHLLVAQWQQYLETAPAYLPTQIVSVPLNIKKWQLRGFNQAHLLAHHFSKMANIPYSADVLIREHVSENQMGKTGAQRRKNTQQGFAFNESCINDELLAEHILLIDDVVTTGTTCNEVCKVLYQHGVKKVTVLSLCLSLPDKTT